MATQQKEQEGNRGEEKGEGGRGDSDAAGTKLRTRVAGKGGREEEEEEESLFKADAVNEEDPERDRATQV